MLIILGSGVWMCHCQQQWDLYQTYTIIQPLMAVMSAILYCWEFFLNFIVMVYSEAVTVCSLFLYGCMLYMVWQTALVQDNNSGDITQQNWQWNSHTISFSSLDHHIGKLLPLRKLKKTFLFRKLLLSQNPLPGNHFTFNCSTYLQYIHLNSQLCTTVQISGHL